MSLPSWGLDRITTEALGWTLVHFLWQGALIAAILCTMDLLLARCRATVRYVTACLAFTFMLLVPVATFFLVRAEARNRPHATYALALPDARASLVAAPLRAPVARGATLAGPARSFRLSSLSRFLPWVVDLWTIGVVLFSLRLLGGWWLVRRLARSSANVTLEAWQSRLHDLAHRIGVSRPGRLCRLRASRSRKDRKSTRLN